jgi:hypothetical protein
VVEVVEPERLLQIALLVMADLAGRLVVEEVEVAEDSRAALVDTAVMADVAETASVMSRRTDSIRSTT